MDDETGVEFFRRMTPHFPNAIRVILTGFTDHKAISDAINVANVYRFISKPWNEIDLEKTMESAVELFDNRISIQQKTAEIKKAYDELSKFVYSASHDMRAPLVSVMGLIDLAKREPMYADDQTYIPLIEKSILKLDTFVRNIVDYYQNREKIAEIEEVNVSTIVEECCNSLNFQLGSSSIDIVQNIHVLRPFYSDKFRVQIILNNLISNAIKYQNPENELRQIFIEVCEINNGVEFKITDNGIGIPESSMGKLFEMFYRATDKSSGSGIGLYIVREAVNALKGNIHVHSVEGEGTSFSVFIPNQIPN